ncbi:MAG: oligosaccharide flippase family protein [Candidatus Bathyarchaeota archaeon]|nr:oligosaccharide flippase family protein [Candidatus Bathyarchaeota archaeon]
MDKALEMGKSSATGSFHLLIGVAGSTIIMSIGTLVLAALLPVEGVGLYGMALIPSSIINFFRDWGVNSALTQQIASLRAAGKESEIHDVMLSGIVFELISGALLSLVCFAIAWPLAWILSPANASDLSVYISIMSLSIFAGAVLAAAGGIFTGFERMKLNSLTQILQAVVKTSLGPFLVVVGFGVLGAVYATVSSFIAGAVVSGLLIYFMFYKPLRKCKVGKCDLKITLKPMLRYGLPLTVANIVVGVMPQVIVFSMAVFAGEWMMGNYYAASYFSVLLTFVSLPIATALFPVFSKINCEQEPQLVKTVFASSVKYTAVFLVPATMLLITLSGPIVNTLFPKEGILQSLFVANAAPKFPYAPLFLMLAVAVNLFVLFGNISLSTFQTGVGKTFQLMKQSVLSIAIGLPVAYVMIRYFYSLGGANTEASAFLAVVGGLIGMLISSTPGMVWGLYWIWKNYKAKADFVVSAKIFVASAVASLVTYAFISVISFASWLIMLIAGTFVFLLMYLASAPLLGAVNQMDIENFRTMFSGLGIISKLLSVPLLFMQKMCKNNVAKKAVVADRGAIAQNP